jgi:hypothetical protein
MTTPTDSDITNEDIEATLDIPTLSPVAKFSKFGNAGFQNGSKFGKPSAVNPQLKQRPGRAAARGR